MTLSTAATSIPDVVWSGILGASLALGGTLLTNFLTYLSLKARISHEATESALKRKSDIRKEVYLQATDALVKTNFYLNEIVNKPMSDPSSGLSNFSAATAKLMLLMTQEDALQISKLNTCYARLFIELMPQLVPISTLKTRIQINEKWIAHTNAEIERILAEQTRYNESGNPDQMVFERLQLSFESQQRLAKTYAEDSERANQALLPLQRSAHMFLLQSLRDIQPQAIKVLMAMRRDFEVGGDEEIFLNEANRASSEALQSMEKVLSELEKKQCAPATQK